MKLSKPIISIIIPVYNVEKYLRRCLDSVKSQTFQDWQAICVDDGSPDKSGKILDEYAKKDKRFIVVHKDNGGLSDARNAGLSFAKGEYIMYLDSDDFIHPQTMEILYFYANKNNADMVVFDIDNKAHNSLKQKMLSGFDVLNIFPNTYNKKYNICRLAHCVTDKILFHSTEKNHDIGFFRVRHCYPVLKMLRKNFAKNNLFQKNIIMEDFPWWSKIMLMRPHTVIVRAPLYFYMPNMSSILNSSKAVNMILSVCKGLSLSYDLYKKKANIREQKYYAKYFLWPFIIIAMRKISAVDLQSDKETIKTEFIKLYKQGVFDNPPTMRARKYKRRIDNFISQIS